MADSDSLTADLIDAMKPGTERPPLAPERYLPHTRPILMIRDIESVGPRSLSARARLDRRSPLNTSGQGVPFWCCLEIMSQAIAVLEGIRASLKGEPPPIGYLLGTRTLSSTAEFLPFDRDIEVSVEEILQHYNGLASVEGAVRWDRGSISCLLSVFRK